MRDERIDHDRRQVLMAGAVAFAAPLVGVASVRAASDERTETAPGTPTSKSPEKVSEYEAGVQLGASAESGPLSLFAPLALGDELGFGWRLREVRGPDRGALLVLLSRDGTDARVHVCRNAGCAAGIASTERYDFLLMNEGHGGEQTDEDLGRAVVALAGFAARSEVVVDNLMTHEERIERWVGEEPGALL